MQIGPYVVEGELGRGGFGVVYRARSNAGEAVAVKVLLDADPERSARFEREQKLLGTFTARDGFVPLLDAGRVAAGPYLVMPLVAGGTLRERLRRGRLEVGEAVALGRSLARALALAHERGIVHRDLKPENVIFDAEGRPLVADLGLAKVFGDSGRSGASLSRTGQGAGTPGYMAPEQIDDSKHVGASADVFALGAILYECLAGCPAIDAGSPLARLAFTARANVKPLREHRPDVPPALALLVHRALADAPEKRFRDAGELERALAAAPRARRSSRPALALAVVAVVSLVGFAALLARDGGRVEPVRPEAAEELLEHGRAALRRGDPRAALLELDKAVALDPRLARAWNARGASRNQLGDGVGAIADFTRAIELSPATPDAWLNRGQARESAGDLAGAIADYGKGIELEPREGASWSRRGKARVAAGDVVGARADFDRAVELAPASAAAWTDRGVARAHGGDHAGALADYGKAIELDPGFALAWSNRGVEKAAAGDHSGAIADAAQVTRLEPRSAEAWDRLGFAKASAGDRKGAIADYTRALELDPKHAPAWTDRADARSNEGDLAGAVEDLTRAIELEPRNPELLLQRFNARKDLGDGEGAVADLERFVAIAPDLPQAEGAREKIRKYRAAK